MTDFRLESLSGVNEDDVWEFQVKPLLTGLPQNVVDIYYYGLTEILNNAIDHSESASADISVELTDAIVKIGIKDFGVGIFDHLRQELSLPDDRQTILELVKGKLTTAPERHSGEGLFFTSRMFDRFSVCSNVCLEQSSGNWLICEEVEPVQGTRVEMELRLPSTRTSRDIFKEYASEENDFEFVKTMIPVHLAQYGDEELISRSQAKRLLHRLDGFKVILLDFLGVQSIGRSFADEVFRVWALKHPNIRIVSVNQNRAIERLIAGKIQG